MSKGRLIVISAPSGAGKGTVIGKLLQLRDDIAVSISATTRLPRTGEEDGVSYYFVPRAKFMEMIKNGELLEYAKYVGEYYGTPKKPIFEHIENGRDVILEIEVQGAKQIMELVPDAITIFIVPPDMRELERRLRSRGTDSEEKLKARLAKARHEMQESKNYANIVVNDDITLAAETILGILDDNKNQEENLR